MHIVFCLAKPVALGGDELIIGINELCIYLIIYIHGFPLHDYRNPRQIPGPEYKYFNP